MEAHFRHLNKNKKQAIVTSHNSDFSQNCDINSQLWVMKPELRDFFSELCELIGSEVRIARKKSELLDIYLQLREIKSGLQDIKLFFSELRVYISQFWLFAFSQFRVYITQFWEKSQYCNLSQCEI